MYPTIEQTQLTFILFFYPSFFTFSSFHSLDLVCAALIPWVVVVLSYLSSRRRLAGGEAPTLNAGATPDCHRN
jgi:hypothetical protein